MNTGRLSASLAPLGHSRRLLAAGLTALACVTVGTVAQDAPLTGERHTASSTDFVRDARSSLTGRLAEQEATTTPSAGVTGSAARPAVIAPEALALAPPVGGAAGRLVALIPVTTTPPASLPEPLLAPPAADPADEPTAGESTDTVQPAGAPVDQGAPSDGSSEQIISPEGPSGAVHASEATTGVPDGTVLTPVIGNLTITTPGAVVQGIDLQGCITVRASDVTIRNSQISCGSPAGAAGVTVTSGNMRLLVEDSEIDGMGTLQIAVGFSNVTLRRVEIRNAVDGVRASTRVTVEDCWIHDMSRISSLHPDAIQSTGGSDIIIRGNTLEPYRAETGNLQNAAIMLGSETSASLSNVLIENNYIDGGNYTVNVRADTVANNIVFRGNVFGPTSRYGPMMAPRSVIVEPTNVFSTTGAPIVVTIAR